MFIENYAEAIFAEDVFAEVVVIPWVVNLCCRDDLRAEILGLWRSESSHWKRICVVGMIFWRKIEVCGGSGHPMGQ